MNSSVLKLQNLIEGFRLSYQTEGKSPKTIEWYITFLNKFCNFLELHDFPTDVSQVNKSHVREFIRYLQTEARVPRKQKPLSGATVQGYVRALKAFYSWATREEYIEKNVLSKYPLPEVSEYIIQTLSIEQVDKILAVIDRNTALGAKYYCILLLLLDTGMRISELANIKMGDMEYVIASID